METTNIAIQRKIIRASGIGHPCIRRIWLSAMGYEEPINEKTQRIFDMGHALESTVLKWLEQDGWTVKANPGSQEADIEVTIDVGNGIISGHPDAIIEREGQEPILVDVKTMKDRQYRFWKRNGTKENKPQYFIQTLCYAHALGLNRVGIAAVNKDNADYDLEVMDVDDTVVNLIKERANYILNLEEMADAVPGEMQIDVKQRVFVCDALPAWCCNYCGYKDVMCSGVD